MTHRGKKFILAGAVIAAFASPPATAADGLDLGMSLGIAAAAEAAGITAETPVFTVRNGAYEGIPSLAPSADYNPFAENPPAVRAEPDQTTTPGGNAP